ncbi:nonribosomal peptide synthase [Trichophyton tonsurans CBS 112818]|uniref:Nonribosomal peptide synthase n=1 Tax=Trichophyton tonsurans (strain CBS 112818) TaxID=647933 RepID=F2RVU9_TRIT1|nr:nonribosomal peptide synthase [Trichophyton tonsurans CBS 112818]
MTTLSRGHAAQKADFSMRMSARLESVAGGDDWNTLGIREANLEQSGFEISMQEFEQVPTAAKICVAWAIILASHRQAELLEVYMVEPGHDPVTVCLEWAQPVGELVQQMEVQAGNILSTANHGLPGNDKEDGGILVEINRDMPNLRSPTHCNGRAPNDASIPHDRLASISKKMQIKCKVRGSRILFIAPVSGETQEADSAFLEYVLQQFKYILREISLLNFAERPLTDLRAISVPELRQVWSWNAHVPQSVNVCVHDIFVERAKRHPDRLAVSAHDGDLTYETLDTLSTQLARILIHRGLRPDSIVIIYIEKSKWVPVAQLAVMKCGCASTVLDASLPLQRQQAIAQLVQAAAVLTLPSHEADAASLLLSSSGGGNAAAANMRLNVSAVLSQQAAADKDSNVNVGINNVDLPAVEPSSRLYIVFTSGSTGTPKGAVINHANYASAVAHQQTGLQFREFDRVSTLLGDLAAALRKYQVNYAVLTPSVAWFPASELPASLRVFHFGGEPLKAELVKRLSVAASVVNAYGPAECSTVSTAITASPDDDEDPTIGTGLGACTWVELDGSDLVPIGEIGELWLEGPIVGQGYLGQPEKTASTFVENPPWLLRGCPNCNGQDGHSGRPGRLYRTGDLVRYRPNGTLQFVGRIDSQIKIRGQRVELGEIEHHLQCALTQQARGNCVQIIADVIKQKGSDTLILVSVVFMAMNSGVTEMEAMPLLCQALSGIEDRLMQLVPPYMIPSAFFPIVNMPMTPTGKIDRRRLRDIITDLFWAQLDSQPAEIREEAASEIEGAIRAVWNKVLNIPLAKIGLDAPFTRLGGDSITAMQVVSRCRANNISITVSDILNLQTVRNLAASSKPVLNKSPTIDLESREGDMFQLSPIQQLFFDNNPTGVNHYTLSYIVKLTRQTTREELSAALLMVVGRHAMDCTQPLKRAHDIINQVKPEIVLLSRSNLDKAAQFASTHLLVVDQGSLGTFLHPSSSSLQSDVQPHHLLYVAFTSGSTGQPKGAMITHSNFSSAIKYQQKALGYSSGHRVYDFASYAFDVSWSNVLHSLTSGSCLCIPSEHQRRNELSTSIRDTRATHIDLTPSVLRQLSPRDLPELQVVLLSGEPFTEADLGEWINHQGLVNTYGPAECSVKATLTPTVAGMTANNIGVGYGLNTWIVRLDGTDNLAPLGSGGELWLEGPLVGLGYLGDETNTDLSFVTRPKWLQSKEKTCRFYRTGDLVRYEPDGTLTFLGRKDSQVKIRGQRTELGEIEYNIQSVLRSFDPDVRVVADVFKPQNSDNAILVAFFEPQRIDSWYDAVDLDEELSKMIPAYMIPTVYLRITSFPLTPTGKTDRKNLRQTHESMTLEQLVAANAARRSKPQLPVTTEERLLRTLWAEVLKISEEIIGTNDSFFRIGGDSISAMQLVAAARQCGIILTVAEIFSSPQLSALARNIEVQKPSQRVSGLDVQPFTLIDEQIKPDEARAEAARLCGVQITDIEDILPCTPLQEGLLAGSVRQPGDNVLSETRILNDVDIDRLQGAWVKVLQMTPIFRTRIMNLKKQGLVQVIIRYECCRLSDGIPKHEFGLGTPLMQYEILHSDSSMPSRFIWSIHHSLYDRWSMGLVFNLLHRVYHAQTIPAAPSFQSFIRHIKGHNCDHAEGFWKSQFQDFKACQFPTLPSKQFKPRCDKHLELDMKDIAWFGDYTAATKIRLAWAILLSTITARVDVSFGATVSGRQVALPDVENIISPTFATVPLRVLLSPSKTIGELLKQVQLQATEMIPYEQIGLQCIQKLGEDCELGCQFQSHMVIQPAPQPEAEFSLFGPSVIDPDQIEPFKLYAISLEFDLLPKGVLLHASYDSRIIAPSRFSRLARRFEHILRQICLPSTQDIPLSSIETNSQHDIEQIWHWNQKPVQKAGTTVHDIFRNVAENQPDAPAICSWDGDFTYKQVNDISSGIAYELLSKSSRQTHSKVVALLFEKSKWTPLSQLAVMKANCTSVVLDSTLPVERQRAIINIVSPRIILTSSEQKPRANELAPAGTIVKVIDESFVSKLPSPENVCLPLVDPESWLYIVFTSGSTGTPKGVVISHSNIASALKHGQAALQFSEKSRVYDFVSYAFDVSWLNVVYTLCAGGCLCIPSQYEIQNEPSEAIRRMNINTAFITPAVGKLLHESDLKVINFGGEILPQDEISYWKDRATIIHSYGPSECTPISISHILDPLRSPVIIGKGLGAVTWVVKPGSEELAAVGDIGELWLEGPLVGQGYLNDQQKTDAVFVRDPKWLLRGAPGFSGRKGRLYRTGDLVRYEDDGNIEFIGRIDTQVKIRGQRVELGDIEHHIRGVLGPAVASHLAQNGISAGSPEASSYAQRLAVSIKAHLSTLIPQYMIPNAYMILDNIPINTSGKVDRGNLRKMVSSLRKEELLSVSRKPKRGPQTAEKSKLHAAVAQVLALDQDTFDMDDNFFQLGGDSISAMKLASLTNSEGLMLRVMDILVKDRLGDLLKAADLNSTGHSSKQGVNCDNGTLPQPNGPSESEVMAQIQPGHGILLDILSTTHIQSSYLEDNLHVPRRSWLYSYIDFADLASEERIIWSCERLVEQCSIYRTAFVQHGGRFFQAVFDSWKPAITVVDSAGGIHEAFERFVKDEETKQAVITAPLLQLALIRGPSARARLVFSMSHAVYDAISFGNTVKMLADIYRGSVQQPASDFGHYIKHIQSNRTESYDFWRGLLKDSSMTSVPCELASVTQDRPPTVLERSIPLPILPAVVTHASLFTFACAAALSHITSEPDVVFGRVVSGRAALGADLVDVIGPCLNRVPVRVHCGAGRTRADIIAAVQRQYAEMVSYETVGLSDIVQNCTGWPQNIADFGCWTQYQNVDEKVALELPGAIGVSGYAETWHLPVAVAFLEIFATPTSDNKMAVRVIAGPGYKQSIVEALLAAVCLELEK